MLACSCLGQGTATVKKYNEDKLEQEPIGDNEFYCRYTLEPTIRRVNVSSTSI
jgi:hypothetical protein